jgi:hypothetical protein
VVDFPLSEENRLVAQSVRRSADAESAPRVSGRDAAGEVHVEVSRQMGELGCLAAPVPEQYGGAGKDCLSLAMWRATEHAVQGALDAIQVHQLIQADCALGYREDRPIRCESPAAAAFDRLPAATQG